MNNSETVYNGNLPFIFVSYAHLNSKVVLPLIKVLSDAGYRIWFDQGIEAGTEWSNNIAAKLRQCSAFIFFVSKQSVESENCLDEVAYAKANKKPSLLIFLEDNVVLPEGTDMQTARFQRMYMSRQQSLYDFINNFSGAKIFNSCKDDSVATQWQAPPAEKKSQNEQPQPETYSQPYQKHSPKKKRKGLIAGIIAAIAVLLAVVITLVGMFIGKNSPNKDPESVVISTVEATFSGDIEGLLECLPEELVDYMIESSYGGDRNAFIKESKELFEENIGMFSEMDIDLDFETKSVKEGSKQEVEDLINDIELYYDIKLDISNVASVEIDIILSGNVLGEEIMETTSETINVFEIDGKWYLNPESLESLF